PRQRLAVQVQSPHKPRGCPHCRRAGTSGHRGWRGPRLPCPEWMPPLSTPTGDPFRGDSTVVIVSGMGALSQGTRVTAITDHEWQRPVLPWTCCCDRQCRVPSHGYITLACCAPPAGHADCRCPDWSGLAYDLPCAAACLRFGQQFPWHAPSFYPVALRCA